MLHKTWKQSLWFSKIARLALVVSMLVVPSLALATEANGIRADQSDALARFHEAKPVSDPANGAWSLAQAEFYVAKYGTARAATATAQDGTLSRFHEAKPVADPANGAWSLAQAEFYVAKYGEEVATARANRPAGGFSGDDPYDPAAGGTPELSVVALVPAVRTATSSLSGDDAYDPAAGDTPELSVVAAAPDVRTATSSLSGDDPYDPAAGGTPELSVATATETASELQVCAPLVRRPLGGYSGDDAYDPAAGGYPPSPGLVISSLDGQLVACIDTAIGQ